MKKYYVYVHFKPDLTPFYVGKGSLRRANSLAASSRNKWHRNVVAKYGADNIIIETLECASEKEALFREMLVIKSLRDSGTNLANVLDGGQGFSGGKHSDETVKAIKEKLGKFWSDSVRRQKASEAMRGRKNRLGSKASEECRRLASERGRLLKHSQEAKDAIRSAVSEKWKDPEYRARLSVAIKAGLARRRLEQLQKEEC